MQPLFRPNFPFSEMFYIGSFSEHGPVMVSFKCRILLSVFIIISLVYTRTHVVRTCAHNKFGRKGTKNILYTQIFPQKKQKNLLFYTKKETFMR